MNSNHFSESEWNSPHLVPLNPNDYETPYCPPRVPPPIEVSPLPGHVVSYPRPKSSPSTFGPNVEDLLFPENPFRIKHEDFQPPMFSLAPMPSTKAPSPYFGGDYAAPNPSASPGRPGPVPIAPDPVGLRQMHALKRMRDEEEYLEIGQKRRKRAPSQVGPVELNEEEQLLLKLKEEENLPWKDIAVRFQTDLGKFYQVPALQMRFKRLRERMRTWTETDLSNKPTTTGRSSNSTSLPQRCWTSELPNVGQQSTASESGRRYTQDGSHSRQGAINYSRIHGEPNSAARWNP